MGYTNTNKKKKELCLMAVLNMNAQTYRKHVSESAKSVLVEFSAPWCGYCRRLEPALELTAQQYEGELEKYLAGGAT